MRRHREGDGPAPDELAADALDLFLLEEVVACMHLRRKGPALLRRPDIRAGIDAGRLRVVPRRGGPVRVVRVRRRLAYRSVTFRSNGMPRCDYVALRAGAEVVRLPFA